MSSTASFPNAARNLSWSTAAGGWASQPCSCTGRNNPACPARPERGAATRTKVVAGIQPSLIDLRDGTGMQTQRNLTPGEGIGANAQGSAFRLPDADGLQSMDDGGKV